MKMITRTLTGISNSTLNSNNNNKNNNNIGNNNMGNINNVSCRRRCHRDHQSRLSTTFAPSQPPPLPPTTTTTTTTTRIIPTTTTTTTKITPTAASLSPATTTTRKRIRPTTTTATTRTVAARTTATTTTPPTRRTTTTAAARILYVLAIGLLLQLTTADIIAPPLMAQTAALASPGGGGGGGGGSVVTSSILEQFSPNCTAVAPVFAARGIDLAEIPQKPNNEMVLRYCESPSVGTCCTYSMETKMAAQSRLQLEKHSREQIAKMSATLATKAVKFNEIFRKLLLTSKEEFHKMFTRTYGVIYQQNSYVFSDLFNELENYYTRGRVDLIEVMDKFFNVLYQKMFEVLNGQYSFDKDYFHCVSEHMKELKPFGDVPDKLSVQIKRSFVATRTYGQALATAADVSRKIINVRLNADCVAALTKMQHCGACKGYAEKPCTNYCVNVVKGCLHYFNELDIEWENFVMAMDKLSERLLGSFNIVMVVEPINIKISEAIMNFQDAGQDITSRVFQGCGHPKLGRAKRAVSPKFSNAPLPTLTDFSVVRKQIVAADADANDGASVAEQPFDADILDIDAAIDEANVLRERRSAEPGTRDSGAFSDEQNSSPRSTNGVAGGQSGGGQSGGGGGGGGNGRRNQKRKQSNRKNDDNDYAGREQGLDKMVREIRQRVKDSKKFWSNLPHQLCSNDEIASSSDADGMCWNGHTIDRYMHSVTTEHARNPEFPGNPASSRQTSQVSTQLYYLKNAIGHLRNAYNGMDVEWSDQEEPYYGSGSGAGSDTSDDEDDDEGSGESGTPFVPSHKPEHTDNPSVRVNNVDDEDEEDVDERTGGGGGTVISHTTRPKYTGGSGGSTLGIDTNTLQETHEDGGTDSNGHGDADDDDNNSSNNDNDDDGGDDGGNDGGDSDDDYKASGGSSSSKPSGMSLRRALLLYLVPLYMAWFGGICAELL